VLFGTLGVSSVELISFFSWLVSSSSRAGARPALTFTLLLGLSFDWGGSCSGLWVGSFRWAVMFGAVGSFFVGD